MFLITLAASALAASLDNLEVGGAHGTPLATNPTAIWWNPAGLAFEDGHRFLVEGAPTFATVAFNRDDPHNGGEAIYRQAAAVPFLGVATDAGAPGLGLGMGLAVPFARGAEVEDPPGPGSFAMHYGQSQAVHLIGSGSYQLPFAPVALGISGALVHNTWEARVDSEFSTALHDAIEEGGGESHYTDSQIENPRYTNTVTFDPLTDVTATFGVGLRAELGPVTIGGAYHHGAWVENQGNATMDFGCPDRDVDEAGRFAAENAGICNRTLQARAQVSYALAPRIHGGIGVEPIPGLTAELMAGRVFWNVSDDFEIEFSDVDKLNDFENPEAAQGLNRTRQRARANIDSFWVGLDLKGRVHEQVVVGGRVMWDQAAIPDVALAPNNYDANNTILSGLVMFEPIPHLQFGLQWSRHLLETREVTESGYRVTIDPAERIEDRWFYPQMAGVYEGGIDRLGFSVHGRFGGSRPDLPPRAEVPPED